LQIVKNVIKFAVLPITASQLLVAVAGQKFDEAFSFAILFGLGSATIGVLSPLVKYVGMFGENKIYRQETGAYFSRLMSSDVEYFNSNLSGYLTTATRQYVDSGVRLARELRDNYLQVFLAFIVPVIVVFTVNFVLGLIMAALGLVQLGYMLWASYRLEPYRKKSREIYKKHSGIMADAISNILAVKATAREESIVRQVKDNSRREGVAFQKRYSVRAKLTVGREIVTVTTYVTLLLMVITMADMGSLSLAGAILVVTYISPVLTAIYQLAEVLDQHDDLVDQLIPGFELMDQQETVKDPLNPRELNRVKGSVSLENVGFSYNQGDDGRVVFSDLTLCIPA
jgi:ATP-binding cassette subfamily B protein